MLSLAVTDLDRANRFYGETLGLLPAEYDGQRIGWRFNRTVFMLKTSADWYGTPTAEPNPRITLACKDADATAAALQGRGVQIADAVQNYDGPFRLGSFLDSEGNKLWFCSNPNWTPYGS
ncbi:MAG: VOC family protein [bacterium]